MQIAPEQAAFMATPIIDMAFIDADKSGYIDYYEELIPRLQPDGIILVDNVLWSGKVLDEASSDEDTRALRAFNDHVTADDRVEAEMVPIADGLTTVRRRISTRTSKGGSFD